MRTGATVSSLHLPPCASYSALFILDPIIFVRTVKILPGGETQKDFEGRWEALSRLITKETRWQFKSRRKDHKWMARGFSTSRRDCQTLNSNPSEILIANWTMKTSRQISLQIESKITKLVPILQEKVRNKSQTDLATIGHINKK